MGRSFLQYINDTREQRLETFASSLSQWYLNEGGWDRIRDDRRAWHQLMFDIARQQRADHAELGGPPPRGHDERHPPPPHRRYTRPTLYDADKIYWT